MVKCETALTSDEKERKMQSERNNSSDTENHGRPEKTDNASAASQQRRRILLRWPKRMSMKMAAVSTISLLLLCCFAISPADSQDRCDYNATKGKDFTVPLSSKLETSHQLQWKHNDNIILNQRQGGTVVVGKKEDISTDGSLILKNLKESDKGIYTPQLFKEDGIQTGNLKSIHLCIFDHVPKPEVTKDCSLPSVTFTCKVPAMAKDLNFAWLQNGNELKEKAKNLKRNAKEVEKDSFQCKVSNPASSETSGPVTQEPCYQEKSIFPETLFGINIWIVIGAGGGLVVVLIIVVIVCCVRTKRKKRMQLKDEGELRLAWTNDQQHQHHQHQHNHPPDPHHHRCQQQPAGHTGPRQHRSKQHREQQQQQQHLRPLDPPSAHPQPSPRRPAQAPRPVDKTDDEQPPPLPQPRKKAAKIPRV
ncbi:T-cell surface antigen CD2 isoform X1 [Sander lucioperca]|uniref:T-cell surface antigen CD2 isoform X1 n=1 Tax=Sander lucioperca TaxID=283035 RepID=UPI00125D6213|nr:T-cell surface antigen CD2 isoform X1 [Sander lucioperca]